MPEPAKQTVLKQFRQIPGVGKVVALDLFNLGFRSIQELKDQDPEKCTFSIAARRE